jgi:S1-C subfamily serine protease
MVSHLRAALLIGAGLTLWAGAVAAGEPASLPASAPATASASPPLPPPPARISPEVIRAVKRAVVRIRTAGGTGTGFLLSPRYVATAYHVISSGRTLYLKLYEGGERGARVVAVDKKYDLAILELDTPVEGVTPLSLETGEPVIGAAVFAVGHPSSLMNPDDFHRGLLDWSVTQGTISGLSESVIQTDAPINPGNSGGPLLSAEGRVLGVASRKMLYNDGTSFAARSTRLAPLLAAVGEQPPFAGENERIITVGGLLAYDAAEGMTPGGVARVEQLWRGRFGLALYGSIQLKRGGALRPADGALQRSVTRVILGAEGSYTLLLGRGGYRMMPLRVSAGAAVSRDDIVEHRLSLELTDPTCDLTAGPCEVETAITERQLPREVRVRPTLGVSLPAGKGELSYTLYLDPLTPAGSLHQAALGVRF